MLVVPIGNRNSLFESHFNVVSRLRNLALYELNRPSSMKGQANFKHFNWSSGELLFDYLNYERVPKGQVDLLDNFQCSRRVLMIMGLVNYPELGNVDIDAELSDYRR